MEKQTKTRKSKKPLDCADCNHKKCEIDKDCFRIADEIMDFYSGGDLDIARAASKIEGEFYLRKTRLEEIILFAKEMKYERIGVAFCVGLAEEARILCRFLGKHFETASVCCKTGGIQKEILKLKKIDPALPETMCNPIGQAILLNQKKTDLNLICGLCIGHDILFTKHSKAPVSCFIVKDRVLGHNTAASLTCRYLRKRLDAPDEREST